VPSINCRNAVKRCFYDGESVKSVSEELGCSTTSLYLWRDKYLRGGTVSLMENNRKDTHKADGSEMSELEDLKAQIRDLQMEVDILKGILDVLKKDPGTDWRMYRPPKVRPSI
jgi:putative transposase